MWDVEVTDQFVEWNKWYEWAVPLADDLYDEYLEELRTLDHLAQAIYGDGMTTRFRPSYFPFTEPSAELALHHLSNVEDLVSQALPMSAKFPVVRQHLMSLLAMAQTQENNIAGADQNFAEALKINANAATVLAWQSLSFAQRSNGAAQALQLAQKAQQTEPQSRLTTFALARAQFR